jgi:hypothetical protein
MASQIPMKAAELNGVRRLPAETTAPFDARLAAFFDRAFKGELLNLTHYRKSQRKEYHERQTAGSANQMGHWKIIGGWCGMPGS